MIIARTRPPSSDRLQIDEYQLTHPTNASGSEAQTWHFRLVENRFCGLFALHGPPSESTAAPASPRVDSAGNIEFVALVDLQPLGARAVGDF